VSQGELKVLGAVGDPVYLTSIDQFHGEYGDPDLANSSDWGGLWFLPEARGSVLEHASGGGNHSYVEGSVLQNCEIRNAGSAGMLAAVYLDGASVLLDGVAVRGSASRGIYAKATDDLFVVKNSLVDASGLVGFYIQDPVGPSIVIEDTNITNSLYEGLYLQGGSTPVALARSYLSGNHVGSSHGRQVFSYSRSGPLSVSSR
jgi:hypothetical protein